MLNLTKDQISNQIYKVIEKIKLGVEQIKKSNAKLWDRDRIHQLEKLVNAYLGSKDIEDAKKIRNYLMYNAHLEGGPWGGDISSTQFVIAEKTNLSKLNGELDSLLIKYDEIRYATD